LRLRPKALALVAYLAVEDREVARMRPSRPLAKKPIGYGKRIRFIRPSLSA